MSIPVYMLAGFLGSGKTTLLLQLLEETSRRGLRPGILMNELGREDVDGAIVQEKVSLPVQKLLDGCICCSKRSEVEGCLSELASREPDLIFMELTGVADPAELTSMFAAPSPLQSGMHLELVVTVVDSSRFLEYNSRFSAERQLVRLLRSQAEEADIILMNKCDETSEAELEKVRRSLRKLNAAAALLPSVRCSVDTASLLHSVHPRRHGGMQAGPGGGAAADEYGLGPGGGASAEHGLGAGASGYGHAVPGKTAISSPFAMASPPSEQRHGAGITSLTLTLPQGCRTDAAAVDRFLDGYRDRLLRAKGYLNISGKVKLVQHSGGRSEWTESSYPGKSYIVLIGSGLPADEITEAWRSMTAPA